jgi:exopolysaccharide biosynthesis polyprenyl glycosylphosphotransferase
MLALKILDQITFVICVLFAASIESRQLEGLSFSGFLSIRLKLSNFLILMFLAGTWYILLHLFGLYHSRRFESWKKDVVDVFYATTVCTLILLITSLFLSISIAKPLFFFLFWFNLALITIFFRIVLRILLEFLRRRGLLVANILMVGTSPRSVDFARSIEGKLELGYHVVGFVDDNWPGLEKFQESEYALVTDFAGLPGYLRTHVVDEVFIDLPLNTFYRQVSDIVYHCLEQGILVRFISDSFYLLRNLRLARSKFAQFDENLVISVANGFLGDLPLAAKRLFDLVVSMLLLAALSPTFFLAAFLIKLTSPGPIFFAQQRLGFNKRLFPMYKFRTMVVDAEKKQSDLEQYNEASGPVFKIKDDPRVTPVGAILRQTSIDELPQLINVLAGDMSLVGPRPLPVRDYRGFNEDWQRRRFSVQPGITCFWQIEGRNSVSFEDWMKLDMEYIDHWSFWLDIKILLSTIPAVIRKKGAY